MVSKKSRTPEKGDILLDGDMKSEKATKEKNKSTVKTETVEYKPEFCEKLLRHFSYPRQKIVYDMENFQSGELKRKKPVIFAPEYPTFYRFARQIGATVPILAAWEKRYPEFAEACAEAREAQKSCVVVNALNRNFDAGFSRFLLSKKFSDEFPEAPDAPGSAELEIHIVYGKETSNLTEENQRYGQDGSCVLDRGSETV